MTGEADATIRHADARVEIVDGKSHVADEGEATIYLQTPDVDPLSRRETALSVIVSGEGFDANVQLDADDVQVLRRVLEAHEEADR